MPPDDKDESWKLKDFGRRAYYLKDEEDYKDRRLEIVFKVDGKQIAQLQAREPGMVAMVSRPDEEGIRLEVISPGGVRYTDVLTPEGVEEQALMPWHKEALGVKE